MPTPHTLAQNLRVAQRVRPVGPRGGWQWFKITEIQRRKGFIVLTGQWIAGGNHTITVRLNDKFRVL